MYTCIYIFTAIVITAHGNNIRSQTKYVEIDIYEAWFRSQQRLLVTKIRLVYLVLNQNRSQTIFIRFKIIPILTQICLSGYFPRLAQSHYWPTYTLVDIYHTDNPPPSPNMSRLIFTMLRTIQLRAKICPGRYLAQSNTRPKYVLVDINYTYDYRTSIPNISQARFILR